jgi:hypothetical protein
MTEHMTTNDRKTFDEELVARPGGRVSRGTEDLMRFMGGPPPPRPTPKQPPAKPRPGDADVRTQPA